jgi:predicted peptidase
MKKLIAIALMFALNASAQVSTKFYTNLMGETNAYYDIASDVYDKTKPAPVIIFLHGLAERAPGRGLTVPNAYKVGLPGKITDGTLKFPGIFLAPQCQYGDWDHVYTYDQYNKTAVGPVLTKPGAYVKHYIDEMRKIYNIDTTRIYVTGLSMGGGGTMSLVQNNKNLAAAAVCIAGWGDASTSGTSNIKTAVWIAHGGADNPGNQINVSAAIIFNNPTIPNHAATIYDGVGHNAWDRLYAEPEFMPWLMSKKLGGTIPPVVDPTTIKNYVMVNGIKTELPLKIEEVK